MQSIELREFQAYSVAGDAAISGISLAPDSTVLIWSARPAHIRVIRGNARRILRLNIEAQDPIAVKLYGDSIVQLFDAAGTKVTTLDATGKPLSAMPLSLKARAVAARFGDSSLYILAQSQTTTPELWRVLDHSAPMRLALPASLDSVSAERIVLSTVDDDVVLAMLHSRHLGWRITPGGNVAVGFHSPHHILDTLPGFDDGNWVGLRIVAVPDGYLRTFADLESDRRLIVYYTPAGRAARTTSLSVPWAIVDGRQSLIAAVRRLNELEVVLYGVDRGEQSTILDPRRNDASSHRVPN
jgi:hypothetical protein